MSVEESEVATYQILLRQMALEWNETKKMTNHTG